jgi:hypothetical protein
MPPAIGMGMGANPAQFMMKRYTVIYTPVFVVAPLSKIPIYCHIHSAKNEQLGSKEDKLCKSVCQVSFGQYGPRVAGEAFEIDLLQLQP